MNRIAKKLTRIYQSVVYRRTFKQYGKDSLIMNPLRIKGEQYITVGSKVLMHKGMWLECLPLTDNPNPELVIGNGCVFGHWNEIYSTSRIVIEEDVLTADRVYISDNLHGYDDPDKPIRLQPVKQLRDVRIGAGSWLGVNVCVMGAHIGRHCVIGANSVVTKDIPDYCVAVGAPARVVKRYDH